MKKIFSVKRLLFFSAALVGGYGIIMACGFFYSEPTSNFTPEAFVKDASYAPLFFEPEQLFYSADRSDPITAFNKNVLTDWTIYLAGKLPNDKIKHFLLDTGTAKSINEIYGGLKGKSQLLRSFPYINPVEPKVRGFFEFLHYAKSIEASCTQSFSWDYDKIKVPYAKARDIQEVEAMYLLSKDPFLKNRFWFQTVKARFYSADKQSVLAFFDKTKASAPMNTLYYRALAYVAGVHYANKNYSMSNYLYSIVFDKCPEVRWVMAYNFHPQEQADFGRCIDLAKNNEEKAALWALFGYYADEKTAIQKIYELVPTSEHLDYLLTRLINKEEARLNGYRFTTPSDYLQAMKQQVSQEALQLVNTIASQGKTGKSFLWNTAAGYLNMYAGNFSVAKEKLDQAGKLANGSLALAQVRILDIMNLLCSTPVLNPSAEEKILPDLKWLYGQTQQTKELRYQNAISWSRRYISSLYKKQGNIVMGELFSRSDDFYRDETNLETMKSFLTRANKSQMEAFAQSSYEISLSDIFEYQGVMRAFGGRIDEAIRFMEKSKERNTQLLANPFNGNIKDCHDCEHAANQNLIYRKLSFLQKMKEMYDLAERGQDVYNNCLLLGNAFYSMTYFGNARVFYYGKIMNQYGNYIDPYYQTYLFNSSLAAKYYQRAYAAATTAEQKAKCSYLLAKCERNDFYVKAYHSNDHFYGDVPIAYKEWAGFKKLKDEYRDTKYCQDVIEECGYFKDYLGR